MKEKTDIDDNILTVNFRKFTQLNNKTQLNEKYIFQDIILCHYVHILYILLYAKYEIYCPVKY